MVEEVSVLPLILLITSLRSAGRSPTLVVAGQRRGAGSNPIKRKTMCIKISDGWLVPTSSWEAQKI